MILAIDVDYRDNNTAKAAGILFENWTDEFPKTTITKIVSPIADYEPGQFYKRELPCILALLNELDQLPDIIIVDGYVFLNENKKGLGAYLYDALNGKVTIIGVAKNAFNKISDDTHVFRGESQKPLFITSVGMTQNLAKDHIKKMHGIYRNPTLLKEADRVCRIVD